MDEFRKISGEIAERDIQTRNRVKNKKDCLQIRRFNPLSASVALI